MRHPRPANCPKRIPLSGEFRSRDLKFSRISYLCIVAVLYLAASRPAKAQESLVYSFSTPNCSAQPDSAPVFDSKGNIYGTCGDDSGNGYVYELSPSGAGGWTAQTIYTFGAGNSTATGSGPNGLIFDSNKVNLYGTTSAGGTNSAGVVYELSPKTGGGWTQTVLYSFGTNGLSDGNEPLGTLVFDTAGNLYGTTFGGGANFDSGTIFELSPGTGNTWTETVIHSFSFIDSNGSNPRNGLLIDASGNLFGTTSSNSGGGTAFELSPAGGGSWTLQTLAVLATNAVGNQIFDSSGNIYGVCKGGFESDGFAYELEKGAGGIWTPLLLYSFGQSATDGTAPAAGVVLGPKGVLYGTTVTGGLYGGIASPSGYGTIYELIPGSPWTEKPLYNFNDSANNDGYGPNSDLALDSSGNIYGSASGGLNAAGTVFELTNPSTVEVPQFSPPPGTYIQPPSVEITDPTPNSVIYYTTTGVAPTTSSTKYAGAITVSATETIEAIAVASGLTNSPVAKATYTITPPAATPTFSPVAGTYPSARQVTISDSTKGATIYYATNATPTTSSTKFSTAIPVNATETLEAIAIAPGYSVSNVGTASFTIETPATTPVISPAAGTYDSAQPVTITDTTPNAVIYYTTNGTSPTTASTKYGGAFTVSASATVEAIAIAPGYDPSLVATAKYVITPPAATPTFTPPAGTYASAQTVTIASATKGALIFYTTNGVAPTVNSAKYTAPIAISKTATLKAVAIDTGYSLSNVGSALYTIETPAAPPVISPVSGSYSGVQTITLTDTTSNTPLATLTPNASGVATFTTSTLSLGNHAIQAAYAGTASYAASSTTITQNVIDPNATTTTLTSSLNPSTYGQPVTFTATVTSASGTPTGSISFSADGISLGTAPLSASGIAQFTTSALTANDLGTTPNHAILATYLPTSSFAASTGSLYQVVNGLPTTTTVSLTPNPSTYGQPQIFSAHVVPITPNTKVPTGHVLFTFCRGATINATLDGSGNATFISPVSGAISNPVGSCTFTAQYFGDTIFASSTSPTYTDVVTPAPSTTTIASASPNPSHFSQPVTFTVQVAGIPSPTADPTTGQPIPPGAQQATGTVNLYDGGVLIGSAPVAAVPVGYQAVFTTSTLSIGTHSITASYSGDANLGGSISSAVVEVITAAPPVDFSLTGTNITFKVLHSGTGDLELTSLNNFAGSIAVTCNPPYPVNYTCTLQSPTTTLPAGGSSLVGFTLHYTETASVSTHTRAILAALFPLTFFSLIGLGLKRRTALRAILSLALLALLTTATTACGTDHFIPITTGTFPITFTATGTSEGTTITHSVTIQATIAP